VFAHSARLIELTMKGPLGCPPPEELLRGLAKK
jgi:hypothetical protein